MSAENVDMQEPLSVEELSSKVLKLELLLDRANKERARVEKEAKEERDVLYKQLNAVTVDHEERLKLKENFCALLFFIKHLTLPLNLKPLNISTLNVLFVFFSNPEILQTLFISFLILLL